MKHHEASDNVDESLSYTICIVLLSPTVTHGEHQQAHTQLMISASASSTAAHGQLMHWVWIHHRCCK
jgi:hypothetical protein